MNTPPIGTKAMVVFDDAILETQVSDTNTQGLALLLQGEPGEQYAGPAADGEWYLAESGQKVIFFTDQYRQPRTGDKFLTVTHDDNTEIWTFNGFDPDDGTYIVAREREGQVYTRQFGPVGVGWTATGWRCEDDEEEFKQITFLPAPSLHQGPEVGDATSRVVNGASLLYRVRSINHIKGENPFTDMTLALVGNILNHRPEVHAYMSPANGKYVWDDDMETEVVFTSGRNNDMALAATRLTTVRRVLRNKYFHFANSAYRAAPSDGGQAAFSQTASAICNEYAELLFLTETGLRYDEDPERYEDFYESLHDEYLASRER